MMRAIAAVLAVSAMMVGAAGAAEKLAVKDSGGTNSLFFVTDTGQVGLGATSFTPDANAKIHVKQAKSGVVALRVENPNIIGASDTLAQEQFVLGPAGSEHVIFQVLSDVQPSFPQAALMNVYTHDFYIRTSGQNVFKLFRVGAVADTMVLKAGLVGIGTSSPTSKLQVVGLPVYANNSAAITGGLTAGAFYRTGADPDVVCVVH
jgi:hypothetical protein